MPAVSGSPTQNSTSVASTLDLAGVPDDAFKAGDLAYVDGIGSYRLVRAMPVPPGNVPAYSGNGYWEPFTGLPVGPAGGDLDGTYPNPTVVGLEGIPIEAGPPTNGDVLLYNAAPFPPGSPPVWEHAPVVFGGGPPVGPAGGSLAGTYPNPTLSLVGTAGTYGSASSVPVMTTTIEGRVSNVVDTPILIAEAQVSNLVADLLAKADKVTNIFAGAGLTGGGNLSADRTISMPNVGTAGTYGNATTVPVLTTDAQGRVSNVATATIGPYAPATAIYGSFGYIAPASVVISTNPAAPTYGPLDTDFAANGISRFSATEVQVSQSGVYRYEYSVQLQKTGGGGSTITIWPVINGTPVPASASFVELGNNNTATFPFCAYYFELNAGDKVQIAFYATGSNTFLAYQAASGIIPAVPPLIVNMERIGDL